MRSSHDESFENITVGPLASEVPLYTKWVDHWSSKRPGTDTFLSQSLREAHPNHSLLVSSDYRLNLFTFPEARITVLPGAEKPLSHTQYVPPARRLGGPGQLVDDVKFASFRLEWRKEVFTVYLAEWSETYQNVRQHFILREGPDEAPTRALILAASAYGLELREEILVFNQGNWQKDHALWVEVQKANWADVILEESFKESIQSDVDNFFASEKIYKSLAIPWKRGVTYLGPPGNGKTISIKAIMKYTKHPSLYVKSFTSWRGEEGSIREVFERARLMSPCVLILEDLDSLINDRNRSFFLNELDGMESQDGILVIGTTNHFDRLDPALSNRPSRFDRKFYFGNPTLSDRIQYGKYWQRKLRSNKNIAFPNSLVERIAMTTEDFSFSHLKEAFVSTLITIASDPTKGTFADIIEAQIKSLRKQIDPAPELAKTA